MPAQLPIDAFPAWAHVNNVCFQNVILKEVGDEKGVGLLAESQFKSVSKQSSSEKTSVLLQVPHDLVLSAEAVDGYAKVDGNFKQLLEVAGGLSTRHDMMLYLISHLTQTRRPGGLTPTPWTKYIRFLPRPVPVPTMWTEPERILLHGTSLEVRERQTKLGVTRATVPLFFFFSASAFLHIRSGVVGD